MDLKLTKTTIKPCRHGIQIWPQQDQVIGKALSEYGEFAESENRIMARYLRAGDVAVDVGANVGTTTLAMVHQVGPHGHVIAFEPQPLVAHCLATALVLNEIDNVRLITTALGAKTTTVKMDFATDATNHGTARVTQDGTSVPMLRLDDLALDRCALIKIDVEGHEWPVIQGAADLIARLFPTVYFEAKRLPGTKSAIAFLKQQNYRLFWHFSFFFHPDNFRKKPDNIFPTLGDMNILAVPPQANPPQDLPEIATADENWQDHYANFFTSRGLKLP